MDFAPKVHRFITALEFHTDLSDIQTAWDLILHKGIAVIFSFFVNDILIKRHSDSWAIPLQSALLQDSD